jgi:hypothetical protein
MVNLPPGNFSGDALRKNKNGRFVAQRVTRQVAGGGGNGRIPGIHGVAAAPPPAPGAAPGFFELAFRRMEDERLAALRAAEAARLAAAEANWRAEEDAEARRIAALPPLPITVPRENMDPILPYVEPEIPPVHCKIALLHGTNSETMFTLPANIEIILFTTRGQLLHYNAVEMIMSWIRKSPRLDTHDLAPYNGLEYDGFYFKGAFPGGNNTPPMAFKLRGNTNFRIKVVKPGQRCPNIRLDIGNRDAYIAGTEPVGIYNPREARLEYLVPRTYLGRDNVLTIKLFNTRGLAFSLEDLANFFIEEYPGEKVRIYMLSCRAGDLVPPNAGNLTPPVTRSMRRGLPNLRGGNRKKRHTLKRRK